ncbi:MAG TPA: type II secretion system protein [Vicinamibacterales bacterium]|nr:type II secretion system protein [Vicinamibacterales bacterium]
MYLEGQGRERGYALAAVLISVAIMSIVMTALLPVWRQQMQREKESELAFRGEQYARAIYLFQRKNGGQFPPSIDALVQGRYLRKKYKDPMTPDGEFLPLSVGANQPGPQGGPAGQRGGGPGQRGGAPGQRGAGPQGGFQPGGQPSPGLGGSQPGGVQGGGGIRTVVSKSKEASIRIYNGASHYNEWQFLYNARGRGGPQGAPGGGPTQGRPGVGAPGQGGPPGSGGPGRGVGPGRGIGPGRGGGPGRGFNPGGGAR